MIKRFQRAAKRLGLLDPQYNFLRRAYWFGRVDSRPVSLFRICFAALLLKNALYLMPVARLLYSDAGIVPRAQFWDDPAETMRFSLMNYFSESWMALLFFALWALVAFALLVGYRTQLMAVLNYLILLSITQRNTFVMTGADQVIAALSFWMIFLPLSQYYSLDRWLAQRPQYLAPPTNVDGVLPVSVQSTYAFPLRAIQLQVALIYIFTSYYKWRGVFWVEGTALFYALQQIGYLLPLGIWLGQVAPLWLLRLLTWLALLSETAFAPLVFSPVLQPWARIVGLLLVALMHLGIAITMDIPDFSIVMWISFILFFAPEWVLWLEQQVRRLLNLPAAVAGAVKVTSDSAAQGGLVSLRRWALTGVLATILLAVIWSGVGLEPGVWNRFTRMRPFFVYALNRQLHLGSGWQMFVYGVIPRTGWLMINGQFEQGGRILLHSSADPQTGQMYHQWGPSARLRLLEQRLAASFPTTILRAWASYYCTLYNIEQGRSPGQRLTTVEIHLRYRRTHRPGALPNPYEDDLLWRHQCLAQ